MMKLILTKHAKQRMIERGIKLKDIKDTLEFPDYIVNKEEKIEAHKKIDNKTLKIIYSKLGNFIKIITVIIK